MLKPVRLERDGHVWLLRDPAHVAAFLASGWKVTEEPTEKPKTRKTKAKE